MSYGAYFTVKYLFCWLLALTLDLKLQRGALLVSYAQAPLLLA